MGHPPPHASFPLYVSKSTMSSSERHPKFYCRPNITPPSFTSTPSTNNYHFPPQPRQCHTPPPIPLRHRISQNDVIPILRRSCRHIWLPLSLLELLPISGPSISDSEEASLSMVLDLLIRIDLTQAEWETECGLVKDKDGYECCKNIVGHEIPQL
ncbi:hypothetical protein BGX38DRAFT_781873 [Terfezia claveryi]|nr:hypothetical protein BGX38DRAFT_781873 [Terfezia claveryi]